MKALDICGGPNYATDFVFPYLFYLRKGFSTQYVMVFMTEKWRETLH